MTTEKDYHHKPPWRSNTSESHYICFVSFCSSTLRVPLSRGTLLRYYRSAEIDYFFMLNRLGDKNEESRKPLDSAPPEKQTTRRCQQ